MTLNPAPKPLPQVYKGIWKGSVVAVKTIVLPALMSGQEKREKMAIMEAAISSALSHPNIMQVCSTPAAAANHPYSWPAADMQADTAVNRLPTTSSS